MDLTPKASDTNIAKINKWECINLKIFEKKISEEQKNSSSKQKKQDTKWDRVFLNHILEKWLISKTYKELIQLKIYIF